MSPATSASASVQTLRSAEVAQDSSTSSAPIARARAVLERELLELAQQPLLAVADLGDSALAPSLSRSSLSVLACSISHFGRSQALTLISAAICPPAFSTALWSFCGRLVAALLAGEEGDRQRLGIGGWRAPRRPASTSPSFQRSTPSAITNRRPMANVIAVSAPSTFSGVHWSFS